MDAKNVLPRRYVLHSERYGTLLALTEAGTHWMYNGGDSVLTAGDLNELAAPAFATREEAEKLRDDLLRAWKGDAPQPGHIALVEVLGDRPNPHTGAANEYASCHALARRGLCPTP